MLIASDFGETSVSGDRSNLGSRSGVATGLCTGLRLRPTQTAGRPHASRQEMRTRVPFTHIGLPHSPPTRRGDRRAAPPAMSNRVLLGSVF